MSEQSIFTIFALQTARILNRLYPSYTNPRHSPGTKKPDLQETEYAILKKGPNVGD